MHSATKQDGTKPDRRWWPLILVAVLATWLATVVWATAVWAAPAATHSTSTLSATISGAVTDPAGNLPPAQTVVELLSANGGEHGHAQVDDSTGNFAFPPVPAGNYVLKAKTTVGSGFTPSLPHAVHVVGDPVDVGVLALTNPSVTGIVFAPDGVTPVNARVAINNARQPVQHSPAPSGTVQIGGLLTGAYAMRAEPLVDEPYWWSPRQVLTVTPGLSQTADFTLQPANVEGTVVDPNGVPVGGATVTAFGLVHHQMRRDASSGSGYFAIGDLKPDTYVLVAQPPLGEPGLMESARVTVTVNHDLTDVGEISLRDAPKIVSGAVETNTGIPVAGAAVVARRLDHPGQQRALTDDNGRYRLHLSGGLWSLTVRHTDATTPTHWVYPKPPQLVHFDKDLRPEFKTVNFEVLTADSEVTGVVEMPDGSTPPFTVTVSLRTNEGIGRSTIADPADGSFTLHVPHGNYVLTVSPHDPGFFGPAPQRVHAPENGTLDVGVLTLQAKDAAISGTVTDGEGNGVEGIRVTGWSDDHLAAKTRTGPDGGYVLPVISGTWQLKPNVPPEMPFVYTGRAISVTIASGGHITDVNFVLTPADNVINGILVDAHGNPVDAQGVAVARNESGLVNKAPIVAGNFTLYLPDGDYQIGVQLPPSSEWLAGQPQPISVAGGESVTLTVPLLPKNAAIAGALWDPRAEIVPTGVNGHVMADNPFAWVGDAINPANGAYELGVSAGLWHLGYSIDPASGYVALDHHKVVPVEAGQTAAVPLPVAKRDSALTGVVLDPNGDPLPGAVVVAHGAGPQVNQVTLRAPTNDAGEFRLALPHGVYHVGAVYRTADWLNPAQKSIVVPANTTISGLEFQFREPDVVLSGTTRIVTDLAHGDGPADGRVHIWAYSNDGAATHTTSPLGETYELNLLSNTRWRVGAVLETSSSFYAVRETVAMTTSNQTLDLVLQGPFPKPGPVVVTFDAGEAQRLELADGTHIFIPAGAMPVEGEVTLHITPIATLPHQHHARLYKYGYAFVALDETGRPITSNFDQNVIITFSYDENALANLGLVENHLKPAYYATSTQSWTIPDSYVVDTERDRVTMQIDHFTDFALLNGVVMEQVYLPMATR